MQKEKIDASSGVFPDMNDSSVRRSRRRKGKNDDSLGLRINIRKKSPKYLATENNFQNKSSIMN